MLQSTSGCNKTQPAPMQPLLGVMSKALQEEDKKQVSQDLVQKLINNIAV